MYTIFFDNSNRIFISFDEYGILDTSLFYANKKIGLMSFMKMQSFNFSDIRKKIYYTVLSQRSLSSYTDVSAATLLKISKFYK